MHEFHFVVPSQAQYKLKAKGKISYGNDNFFVHAENCYQKMSFRLYYLDRYWQPKRKLLKFHKLFFVFVFISKMSRTFPKRNKISPMLIFLTIRISVNLIFCAKLLQ